MKINEQFIEEGPFSQENWLAFIQGKPSAEAEEYQLFTDAYITGELSTGCEPYQLFNMVALPSDGNLKPSISLRINIHIKNDPNTKFPSKTNVDRYHAGYIHDEIAAILSLSMGIRLKSGGMTRRFELEGDVRGRPVGYDSRPDPELLRKSGSILILPEALGQHKLESSNPLLLLPLTPQATARALVKSARLYQDAVWIVESQTSLAWVLLVSAVETSASEWRKKKVSAVDKLKIFKPDLVIILKNQGGDELVRKVANIVADYIGATKTFTDFLIEYLPEPPTSRPQSWAQIEWNTTSLKKIFGKIYSWRSKALHGGIPFPFPMCQPPFIDEGKLSEKPFALATAAQGGVWRIKDTPILFHTFEYIARNSIISWWKSNIKMRPDNKDLAADG